MYSLLVVFCHARFRSEPCFENFSSKRRRGSSKDISKTQFCKISVLSIAETNVSRTFDGCWNCSKQKGALSRLQVLFVIFGQGRRPQQFRGTVYHCRYLVPFYNQEEASVIWEDI